MSDGLLNRREALAMMMAGAASAVLPISGCREQPRLQNAPNIVLILIDDMGWRDLSCYGSNFYETPNIDQLARQGMRFSAAYSASPICSPARAGLLTGLHPARLGLTDWIPGRKPQPEDELITPPSRDELPTDATTLAEALRPLGYTTASIGKWHLGSRGTDPRDHGFDINIGGSDMGYTPNYFHPYQRRRGVPHLAEGGSEGEYLPDRLSQEASEFMRDNAGRPFFLLLSHYAVHKPIQAKPELAARYEEKVSSGLGMDAGYAAMVQSVDESVGNIMRTLDELNLADNTILVFTSDNGGLADVTSNGPLRAGKGHLYEGGIRVPLIVRRPGVVPANAHCDVPVTGLDLYPTLLDAIGAAAPAGLDGAALTPLLREDVGTLPPRPLFWHFPHYGNQGNRPSSAVRLGPWKLIEFFEGQRWELYNLDEDLGEQNDLAASHPEKLRELQAVMESERRRMQASLPRERSAAGEAGGNRLLNET